MKRAAMIVAAGALMSAAGCGPFSEGFDKGFNESWSKSVKEGCLKTATKGVEAAVAESYCSCVVDELGRLTVKERMDLKDDSPAMTAVVDTCVARQQRPT